MVPTLSSDCHTTKISNRWRFRELSYGPFQRRPAFSPASENRLLKIYLKSDFCKVGVCRKPVTCCLIWIQLHAIIFTRRGYKRAREFCWIFLLNKTPINAPNDVIQSLVSGFVQKIPSLSMSVPRMTSFEISSHFLGEGKKLQNFRVLLHPLPTNIMAWNLSQISNVSLASRRHQIYKNLISDKFLAVTFLR